MRATYKRRRDVMIESFAAAGWPIEKPSASMFAWTPVPERFRHLGSLEFSKLLIEKADVAVAPGIGFGEHGDDFVRLALVENEQRIRQAARGVRRFFETADADAAQCGEAEEAGVRARVAPCLSSAPAPPSRSANASAREEGRAGRRGRSRVARDSRPPRARGRPASSAGPRR